MHCGGAICDLGATVCCEPPRVPGGAEAGSGPFCAKTCPRDWGAVECEKGADCTAATFCCGAPLLNGAMASVCYPERCHGDSHDLPQLCATTGECSGAGCIDVQFCAGGHKVCGGEKLPSWCR